MSPASPAAPACAQSLLDLALRAAWAELRTRLADAPEEHLSTASMIAWEAKQHGGGDIPIAREDLEHFVTVERRPREAREAGSDAAAPQAPQTTPNAGPWLPVAAADDAAVTVAGLHGIEDDIEGQPGSDKWGDALQDAIAPADLEVREA